MPLSLSTDNRDGEGGEQREDPDDGGYAGGSRNQVGLKKQRAGVPSGGRLAPPFCLPEFEQKR